MLKPRHGRDQIEAKQAANRSAYAILSPRVNALLDALFCGTQPANQDRVSDQSFSLPASTPPTLTPPQSSLVPATDAATPQHGQGVPVPPADDCLDRQRPEHSLGRTPVPAADTRDADALRHDWAEWLCDPLGFTHRCRQTAVPAPPHACVRCSSAQHSAVSSQPNLPAPLHACVGCVSCSAATGPTSYAASRCRHADLRL